MKLVTLINYFRQGGNYEDFCKEQSLNITAEVIEIYMQKPFCIENDLAFFEIGKTKGKIEYTFNEVIAKSLYDYAMNDA